MTAKQVGQGLSRVDGREKVMGRVVYAGDDAAPGMVYAVLVQATIARGANCWHRECGGAGDAGGGGGVHA